jgi:dTDP-4-dehydrorhamnose 3,5-epimerase
MDAIVDLQLGSPTFGKHFAVELSAKRAHMISVDKGVAHAFYVLSGEAILHYRASTLYSASHDKGIRWNSAAPLG